MANNSKAISVDTTMTDAEKIAALTAELAKAKAPKADNGKPKAEKADISNLVVLGAWLRKSKTSGRVGWFGRVQDTTTGQVYQVTYASPITPKVQ